MDVTEKPLGVGEILDRSLQIYRQHFAVIFMFVVLFLGPAYLISQAVAFDFNGIRWIPDRDMTFEQAFNLLYYDSDELSPLALTVTFFLFPLYMLFVFPVILTSHLELVRLAREGKPVLFNVLLKRAFQRYFPAVGNTFLFGVLIIVIYSVLIMVLAIGLAVTISVIAAIGNQLDFMNDPFGASAVFFITFGLLYAFIILVSLIVIYFFMIRLCFYHPAVVLEGERLGLGRSWALTRRSFGRIFAVFLISSVLFGVFSFASYGVLVLFKLSLIGHILSVLLQLILLPIFVIPYAVVYFDQKNRIDGADLEAAIEAQRMEVQHG